MCNSMAGRLGSTHLPCRLILCVLLLALMLPVPRAFAAGAAAASQGSAATAQPPTIPLDLPVFAVCDMPPNRNLTIHKGYEACTPTPSPASTAITLPRVEGPWTSVDNCELSLAYNQEHWDDVQQIVKDFLKDLAPYCHADARDPKVRPNPVTLPPRAYYSALFLNEAIGGPALARVLIHDPAPEIYGNRVGSYDLYDLQLLPDLGINTTTKYQASTSPNPQVTQVPGTIAQLAGAVAGVPPQVLGGPPNLTLVEPPREELLVGPKAPAPPKTVVIRRVNSPSAFKRGGLVAASVVPQVSVTDQLGYSAALENYMLGSFHDRANRYDRAFQGWDCHQPPCTAGSPAGTGPVGLVNAQLALQYVGCRQSAPPMQLSLTVDPGPYKVGADVSLSISLKDGNGNAVPESAVSLDVKWQKIDQPPGPVVDCVASPTKARCASAPTVGVFAIRATVKPQNGFVIPGAAPLTATASIFVQAVTPATTTGTLVLGDHLPSSSAALAAAYTLQGVTVNPVQVRVQVLEAGTTSSGRLLTEGTASANVASGFASGAVQLDPGLIGTGDRAAVLQALVGSWQTLGAAGFKLAPGAAGAGSGAAGGSTCTPNVTPYLGALVDGLTGSQEFQLDFTDLNTSYASLLALATASPSQPPSTATQATQYTFGRLTRWSFSLGVAGMVGSFTGNSPATVTSSTDTSGKNTSSFSPNPPSPALTFVTADLHPWPYDETTFTPTRAERIRLMFGAAITPNAGIVLGGGYSIVRGLSLEAGSAFLLGNLLPSGKHFFEAREAAGSGTKRGLYGRFFVGLGYSFQ